MEDERITSYRFLSDDANARRLPPHQAQVKTSNANVLRGRNPGDPLRPLGHGYTPCRPLRKGGPGRRVLLEPASRDNSGDTHRPAHHVGLASTAPHFALGAETGRRASRRAFVFAPQNAAHFWTSRSIPHQTTPPYFTSGRPEVKLAKGLRGILGAQSVFSAHLRLFRKSPTTSRRRARGDPPPASRARPAPVTRRSGRPAR